MINPAYFNIQHEDGSKRAVIIEPVLQKTTGGVMATGNYKIYKNSVDNQSGLFTEKLEIDEKNDDLADESNPDFLGNISIDVNGKWHYEGSLLNAGEQGEVAGYIKRHQ
ncbi:hypothetical protein ACPPVU_07275 [Mucilaginibacter sp. McL0603]|uniref:hypothetical protein n=1 Tax=Mucilaginibacter sp. McL0603 TaxID=3415670 RepID=UPI003CEFF005